MLLNGRGERRIEFPAPATMAAIHYVGDVRDVLARAERLIDFGSRKRSDRCGFRTEVGNVRVIQDDQSARGVHTDRRVMSAEVLVNGPDASAETHVAHATSLSGQCQSARCRR